MKQIAFFFFFLASIAATAQVIRADELRLKSGGTITIDGYTVHGVSNDPALADSSTIQLITEAAAKGYADTKGRIDTLYKINDTTMVVVYAGGMEDTLDVGGGSGSSSGGATIIAGGYSALRVMDGSALPSQIILSDWEKVAPDGDTLYCVGGNFFKITFGSKTENGGTVIVMDDSTTFERQWDYLYVKPEWWEPGGYDEEGNLYTDYRENDQGIYNEGDRIRAALNYVAALETKASVVLESRTYMIGSRMSMKNPYNVKLIGNGATVKLKAPPVTTTLTATLTSVDWVRVASTTGFRVGQQIIVTDSSATNYGYAYDENHLPAGDGSGRYIKRISGDTIFVENLGGSDNWAKEIAAGNNCSISSSILTSVNNARIENITFDGNRQANQVTFDWRFNKGIFPLTNPFSDRRVDFDNVTFKNMPGTCVSGGGFYSFQNCRAFNVNGGLFHNSLSPDTPKTVVYVDNFMADSIVVADRDLTSHDEAIFTFSAASGNLYVTNAEVRNLFGNVWGDQGFSDTDIYISNSHFQGKSRPNQLISNVTNSGTGTETKHNIHLDHVAFENCGDLIMNGGVNGILDARGIYGVNISHCQFTNSRLAIVEGVDFTIDNCEFREKPGLGDFVSYDTSLLINTVSYEALVLLKNCDHFTFSNNKILGDRQYHKHTAVGLFLLNNNLRFRKDSLGVDTKIYYTSNQNIHNNIIAGVSWGIAGTNIRGPGATETPMSGIFVGIQIHHNKVYLERKARNEFVTTRPFYGIMGGPGYIVSDNYIVMPDSAATSTEAGLCLTGVTSAVNTEAWGAKAYNNHIYSLPAKPSIRGLDPRGVGGHNNIVYNNVYTGTLVNMDNDYNADNKRLDTTMLPNLTSPIHPVYSEIYQYYDVY